MERCPTELWTYIFELACTDGGATGCSLGLVSHYFREAVLPVQLHSVALYELEQMWAFADFLEQREPINSHVRHLFLKIDVTDPNILLVPARSYSAIMDDVLPRILSKVAPELLSLTSTLEHMDATKLNTLDVPFPRLIELTLSGGLFYPAPSTHAAPAYFPSLRHLTVPASHNIASLYTSRAPVLMHLRLPAVSSFDPELERSLKEFLAGAGTRNRLFPSTIRKITIHKQQAHPDRIENVLRTLTLADKSQKLEIVTGWDIGHTCGTRGDWEDRITGRCCCWGARMV